MITPETLFEVKLHLRTAQISVMPQGVYECHFKLNDVHLAEATPR